MYYDKYVLVQLNPVIIRQKWLKSYNLADYKHVLEGKESLNRRNDKDFLIESLHHSGCYIGYVTGE